MLLKLFKLLKRPRVKTQMEAPKPRYRLRQGQKIVGYMRQVGETMVMYSRDSFWWTGHKLEYEEVDEWTGLQDKNGRHIFEWDILYYKRDPDGENETGVILWEGNAEEFGIRDVSDGSFIPLSIDGVEMFNPRQLQVFSYLFLNPDLQKKLGVEE